MQITLGALADPLRDQLAKFKLTPDQRAEIERLDMDACAISRLYIRSLIPESQATKARQKLMRKIEQILATEK